MVKPGKRKRKTEKERVEEEEKEEEAVEDMDEELDSDAETGADGATLARAMRAAEAQERRAAGRTSVRAAKKQRVESEDLEESVLGVPAAPVLTETRYGLAAEAAPRRRLAAADLAAAAVLDDGAESAATTELRARLQAIEQRAAAARLDGGRAGAQVLAEPEAPVVRAARERRTKYAHATDVLTRRWARVVAANRRAAHVAFPLRNEDVREFSVDTTRGLSSRASLDAPNALEARIRTLLRSSGADRRSVAAYERELRNHGLDAMDDRIQEDQERKRQEQEQEEQQQQGEQQQESSSNSSSNSNSRGDRKDRRDKRKKKQKRPLTPEEEEERRMGMRLYYQQLKNMRHNRIKSKSFRKLERLRKEELREMAREEREAADPEYADAQAERQDLERVRERATLKHSKATRAISKLRRKGISGSNPEVKQMLADRARISRELKRKMDDVTLGVLGGSGGGGRDEAEDPETHQNFFTFDVPEIDQGDEASSSSSSSGKGARKGPRDDYDDTLAAETAKEQVRAHRDEQQQKVAESLSAVPDADAPAFAGATARVDKKGLGLTVSGNVTVVGAQTASQDTDTKEEAEEDDAAQNPWLAVPSVSSSSSSSSKKASKKRHSNDDDEDDDDGIDVDVAIAQKEDDGDDEDDEKEEDEEEEEKDDAEEVEDEDDNDADIVEHDETQARLVAEAFAADDSDLQAELDAEKVAQAEEEAGLEKDSGAERLPGWGQWAGEGVQESARARERREARERAEARARQEKIDEKIAVRRDATLRNVVINEKLDKKILKYKLDHAPLGQSKEVYNRTIAMPVGKEWQTARAFKDLIEPAVRTQRGRVIEPMAEPVRITSKGTVGFADRRTKKDNGPRGKPAASAAAPATSISNARKKPQKPQKK